MNWSTGKISIPMADWPKKTVLLKRIGNLALLYTQGSLRLISLKIAKDPHHRLIHKYEKDPLPSFGFLGKLLKNPEKILKMKGSKRINLLIFLTLRENVSLPPELTTGDLNLGNKMRNGDLELGNKMKNGDLHLGKKQCTLLKLISGDPQTLEDLLHKSPGLFLMAIEAFNIKNTDMLKKEITILKEARRGLDVRANWLNGVNGESNLIHFSTLPMRIHADFCLFRPHLQRSFGDEYEKMIEGIKRDELSTSLIEESVFYPEVLLFNDFLLSRFDLDIFNKDLLKRKFTTKNEILVRNYIRKKIRAEVNKFNSES